MCSVTNVILIVPLKFSNKGRVGIMVRIEYLRDFLMGNGFHLIQMTPKEYLFGARAEADLILIPSFVNSWLIPISRFRGTFVWVDAMDSVFETIRWQFRSRNFRLGLSAFRNSLFYTFIGFANLVTYVSRFDQEKDFRQDSAFVLSTRIRGSILPTKSLKKGGEFIVVGDWSYYPNQESLKWFLSAVLRNDFLSNNNLNISVAGPNIELVTPAKQFENITFRGFLPTMEIYSGKYVHVNPTLFGGGIKTKSIEALANNQFLITLPHGSIGILPNPRMKVVTSELEMRDTMLKFGLGYFDDTSHGNEENMILEPDDILDVQNILRTKFF